MFKNSSLSSLHTKIKIYIILTSFSENNFFPVVEQTTDTTSPHEQNILVPSLEG